MPLSSSASVFSFKRKVLAPTIVDSEPGEHVTITRLQLLSAIKTAARRASLQPPRMIAAEDEHYRLVSHQLAHKWVDGAPSHKNHEGYDCEDIARKAEDTARSLSERAHQRFAFGLCKGKLRSNGKFHMVNLYFDPIQGASLIDNNGNFLPWVNFSSIELALVL
jgi:hypothetical protein